MITHALINPRSIAVIGGSNHIHKPGGRLVKNLIEGPFTGDLYIVNPKERLIQGRPVTRSVNDLPTGIELGVLAVSAAHCTEAVRVLVEEKGARAIIIISAGFSEESTEGAAIEREICRICTAAGTALIGPNCIGLANPHHHAVFTSPVPALAPGGVDLISASGGVALFIIECALTKGLRFHSLWSVGNAAQTGIEEVLEYMDEHFDPSTDARIKALYIEDIRDAEKLVRHAASLVRKGCRIAAIKGGTTESGMRASAMHTGARPTSEEEVASLFRRAGIVRCYSREELIAVACAFALPRPHGRSFAVVTHAGGAGVILTDALVRCGMKVPAYHGAMADELKARLLPGASVANPIDILGTGSAADFGLAIDYADQHFPETDAIAVIFGSIGLGKITAAVDVILEKMQTCSKPIYPILPSVLNTAEEIAHFVTRGGITFPDEVTLAQALGRMASL